MHPSGMHRKGQQFAMPEENFLKTGAVADNNVLRAEDRARKMVAIGPAEDFDEVFLTLEIAHQLMNQPECLP